MCILTMVKKKKKLKNKYLNKMKFFNFINYYCKNILKISNIMQIRFFNFYKIN